MRENGPYVMRVALLLVAACIVNGCVDPDRTSESDTSPSTTVRTWDDGSPPSDATRGFQQIWIARLHPNLTEEQMRCIGALDVPIRAGESLLSRQVPYRACLKHVNGSVTEGEREWRILYGELSDLEREGQAWQIVADPYPGAGNCVVVYLDERLELVFAWTGLEG